VAYEKSLELNKENPLTLKALKEVNEKIKKNLSFQGLQDALPEYEDERFKRIDGALLFFIIKKLNPWIFFFF
jgi:hypothetical protein